MRRRRTRRCSAVTALASRGASALQAWLWLLVFIFQNEFWISDSIQPGYLDFDNLPDTNFTCAGKVIGGYYADLETSCQMFHVCTVGQGDEPMDIKFLCLNGTVFDQETRVCERVDEVDCTKSEKFYSLNLELYGSTVPPPIEPEHDQSDDRSHEQPHDQSHDHNHDPPSSSAQPDPSPQAPHDLPQSEHHTEHVEPVEDNNEPEEELEEEVEEDYEEYTPGPAPSTTSQPTTSPVPHTPPHHTAPPPTTAPPTLPPSPSTSAALPTYGVPSDPTLLSPHEFTYQHARPAAPAPALSFQRQSYPQHAQPPRLTLTSHRAPAAPQPQPPPRPADQVYITAAPPPPPPAHDPLHYSELEQIDHYELYESSKNAPRRPHDRPAPFLSPHASRTPQGFRPAATVTPPRSQLTSPGQYDPRPVQSYQPSERHEILYDERYRPPPPPPPAPTYDYNRFHFDRKRSHETEPTVSNEARPPPLARSASSTSTAAAAVFSTGEAATERPTPKAPPKSPPRVIVTASASVSDSNGKKLNYTVGNVVSAVKPIVAINYDDYKESDHIFDPFFLDVPKLKRRRKTPAVTGHDLGKRSAVITLLQTPAAPLAAPPAHSQNASKLTTTPAWLPPDYVDDNYEPNAYVEAPPPQPPPETLPGRHESKKDKKKDELIKKAASKIVVSSQAPATSAAPTSARPADKRLGGMELDVWRMAARWPTALRPLLEALQRGAGGGSYRLVRAEQLPRRRAPGRFSCEDRRPYEVTVDAHDCRTFHVCAGGANDALHVELQCALGLRYDLRARGCVPPARGQPACRAPLDNV